MKDEKEVPSSEKEKSKDESVWEIVSVPTQTAPAYHNKTTNEVLGSEEAVLKILEGIEFIKRRVG